MTQTEFHLTFEQQVKRCEETLLNKAKEYTLDSRKRDEDTTSRIAANP